MQTPGFRRALPSSPERAAVRLFSTPARITTKIPSEGIKMTYQLPPDIDQRIQSQIALGIYQTPDEVLDALEQRRNLRNPPRWTWQRAELVKARRLTCARD
jgi:hypothetical protein